MLNPYPDQSRVGMDSIEDVVSQIFSRVPLQIEPTTGGISTSVYRIIYPHETFYLRLLRHKEDSFASEVAVHAQLRQMQVKAPDVIHFEHFNKILQRSVMVTTAIKGNSVMDSHDLSENVLEAIMIEAGQDLARINTIAVNGFGWLRGRSETEYLLAPYPTYKASILAGWDDSIRYLASSVLLASEVDMVEQLFACSDFWVENTQGHLAHGDFGTRHIFQEKGHYTGIIDFGDSQGADQWYDLGYFHMRNAGSHFPSQFEEKLLRGYREVVPLPLDYERHIRLASILITVKALASTLQRHPPDQLTQEQLQTLRYDLAALF